MGPKLQRRRRSSASWAAILCGLALLVLPAHSAEPPARLHAKTEAEIEAKLDKIGDFSFEDKALSEVVEQLAKKNNLRMKTDWGALRDNNVGPDARVIFAESGIALRSALEQMLDCKGLTYYINGDALSITTDVEAEWATLLRVYDVDAWLPNDECRDELAMRKESDDRFMSVIRAVGALWTDSEVSIVGRMLVVRAPYQFHQNLRELFDRMQDVKATRSAVTERSTPTYIRQEAELETRLEKIVSYNGPNMGLDEFADLVEKREKIPLILDDDHLAIAGIPRDAPVVVDESNISLRKLLRSVGHPLGLDFVVRREAVLISSKERISEIELVRVYDVSEWLHVLNKPISADEKQTRHKEFLDAIVRTCDPADNVGGGVALFDGMLIVFQNELYQNNVRELLDRLAEAKKNRGGGTAEK